MQILQTVTFIVAYTVFVEQTNSRCACSAFKDECCMCNENIPRPQTREAPKQSVSKIFHTTSSTCSCGQTLVQPALPPKPLCSSTNLATAQVPLCKEKNIRAPELLQGARAQPKTIYSTQTPEGVVVADAVSLSLAYQMAQSHRQPVPEDKLQYGFQTEPISTLNYISRRNIPEEKLWTVNRAVVELKSTDDVNNSESAEDEEKLKKLHAPGYLTYRDIGYCPEKQSKKVFSLKLPSFSLDPLCSNNPETISDSRCGFQPGKIILSEHHHLQDKVHTGIENCLEHQ